MAYIVDGIGEFTSLGAALQAAIKPDDSGLPRLRVLPPPPGASPPKALPPPPQLTRPSGPPVPGTPVAADASDPLKTALLVGAGLLAAYVVYTLVTEDKSKDEADDEPDEPDEPDDEPDEADDEPAEAEAEEKHEAKAED